MAFQSNRYLTWYIATTSRSTSINLFASGVHALDPADLDVPRVDPSGAARLFEEGLARWLSIPADEVLFTPGATGGTLLALLALAEPGDEILVEAPVYEPMLRQALRLGTVKRFSRLPSNGWRLPVDEVLRQMTDRTRLVMITEPSNPSGTFLPRDQVLSLADAVGRRGGRLLVNEVYRLFTDAPSYHLAAESIVVVSSLSKLLGPYWARLGWLSASESLVSGLRIGHWNMGMPTAPAAAAGLAVLSRADDLRSRAMEISASGLDVVDRWVSSTPGLSWTRPQGTGFGCVHLPESVDDLGLCEVLDSEHGVLPVPGTFFGVPGSIRLSWLQAGDRLEEGLSRVARGLAGG